MEMYRNVILITVDSLRYDFFIDVLDSVKGSLDAWRILLGKGSLYREAYSPAPYTSASMYSLHTMLYPSGRPFYDSPYPVKGVYRLIYTVHHA